MGCPFSLLAAAAVIVVVAAAAVPIAGEAVVAAAEEQQDQNDDPPAVVATTIVTTHNHTSEDFLERFTAHSMLFRRAIFVQQSLPCVKGGGPQGRRDCLYRCVSTPQSASLTAPLTQGSLL